MSATTLSGLRAASASLAAPRVGARRPPRARVAPRHHRRGAATIRAIDTPSASASSPGGGVTAFAISRADFESQIGPLSALQAEQYLADPRKLLADFYRPGDSGGPGGTETVRYAPPITPYAQPPTGLSLAPQKSFLPV